MALTKVTGHVIKSDTNIISHNINSSGIITAVTFDGNVSGVAITFTGDSTIGSLGITTNLTVGGNIDVDGHTELDNINIAGVSTHNEGIFLPDGKTAKFGNTSADPDLEIYHGGTNSIIKNNTGILYIGANYITFSNKLLNETKATFNNNASVDLYYNGTKRFETTNTGAVVSGILTVTGNMNVEGVLTYQDVTNIDSIGIVTARAGIVVQDDASFQTANGGNIFIDKSDNSIRLGQSVGLFYGVNKMWMQHNGSTGYLHNVTGSLYIRNEDSSGDVYIQGKSGEHSIICNYDGNVQLYNDGTIRFNTTSTGVTVHGSADPDLKIRQGASSSSGSGFLAYENVDGNGIPRSIAKIQGKTTGNGGYGELNFQTAFNNTLSTRWTIDHTGHLVPGSAGAVNIGSASAEIGDVYIADDKKFYAGSDQNISLYHTSSNGINHLVGHPGNMFYHSATHYFTDAAQSQLYAQFIQNSYCELRYSGAQKIKTSATGIDVTGEVKATQDYPTFRPTLDLNFAAVKKLDPRITFQRTGLASFVNEFGKIVLVGDNAPRFDHDPMTRESKGLLIEESRTNVAESSEDFGNTSFWVPTSQTITTNVATAPDGTLTADNIIPASGNAALRYLYFSGSAYSMSTNTKYATSIFVKKNGLRYFALQAHDNGSGSGHRAGFDLDNGTVVTSNNMGSASNHSASIVEFPNGWFRCILTGTTASSGSTGKTAFSFSSALDGNASVGGITADGSSGGYVWGHQVEAGAFATSYIPTTGSTVTRGSDLVEITEEEFSEFYNRTEGSFVSEIMLKPSFPVTGYASIMMTLSDGSYDNRVTLGSSTGSAAFNADVSIGGTNNRAALGSYTSGSHSIKAAIAYKAADSAGSLNGAAAVTSSPSGTLPLLTRADIGKDHANYNLLNGHMKRLMYYPKRLPNSQLVTLTS